MRATSLPSHWRLPALLAVCGALRATIVAGGGQFYWADEVRYYRSWEVFGRLTRADFSGALDFILSRADHTGFILIGLPAAAAQTAAMTVLRLPFEWSLWVPALVLSLASLCVIALIHRAALRAGAGEDEALAAAALAACSGTLFYYSRHLLPYDAAMALCLAALVVGLAEDPSPRRSLGCGLLSGLAVATYNGYWASALLAAALHCGWRAKSVRDPLRRAAPAALGLAAPVGLLAAGAAARGLPSYWDGLSRFSHSAAQGDFSEGWRLPFEFLWQAEHGLALAWCLGAGILLWGGARGRRLDERARLWAAGAAVLYALLAVPSSLLREQVVYGRTARQLVPYLCLMTAAGLPARRVRWAAASAAAALLIHAAASFRRPLLQAWPIQLLAAHPEAACAATVEGPDLSTDNPFACSQAWTPWRGSGARFVLLNALHLYPALRAKAPPAGKVLWREPHPLQFSPYLYEGFRPEERALLRATDISLRLVDTRPD